MEKIKIIYKEKTTLCNCILLAIIVFCGWLIFRGHYSNILTDVGREMLFPEAVMKRNVLYKDILCIYFPLAYQLNALAYLIFGASIQTLELCGLFNITLFVLSFFLLSKEFLNEKLSFVLALTVLISSAFNGTLFNMILPYSTGFTYGITASVITILLAVKYIKTGKFFFLARSYLFCGIAFTFKGEFGLILPVLIYLSFFAKPCGAKKNCINTICFTITPIVSLGVLLAQGLAMEEIVKAANFMRVFFSTDSMIYHLGKTGGIFTTDKLFVWGQSIVNLLIFYGISFFLFKKTKNNKLILVSTLICATLLNVTKVWLHTVLIPIALFVLLLRKYNVFKQNLPVLILLLSAIALTARMFWSLILSTYGLYTAPVAILTLLVLAIGLFNGDKKEEIKKFAIFVLSCYMIYFLAFDIYQFRENNTKIQTEKGRIYLPQKDARTLNHAITYIFQNTTEEQKVLFLQEGTFLNFLTDRPIDLKMHMADRLYYEAIGEEKIVEDLKSCDYEVIFLAEGYGLTRFGKPYLYGSDNAILRYIFENYNLEWRDNFTKKGIQNNLYCLRKK